MRFWKFVNDLTNNISNSNNQSSFQNEDNDKLEFDSGVNQNDLDNKEPKQGNSSFDQEENKQPDNNQSESENIESSENLDNEESKQENSSFDQKENKQLDDNQSESKNTESLQNLDNKEPKQGNSSFDQEENKQPDDNQSESKNTESSENLDNKEPKQGNSSFDQEENKQPDDNQSESKNTESSENLDNEESKQENSSFDQKENKQLDDNQSESKNTESSENLDNEESKQENSSFNHEKNEQLDDIEENNDITQIENEEKKQIEDALDQMQKEQLKRIKEIVEKYKDLETNLDKKPLKNMCSHLNSKKQKTEESYEEQYQLSEETNQFINQLQELPSFENRDRGPGYSIDVRSYTDLPDSMIRTLITKFLNQRFCKRNLDLNTRSNSLEKANGFYKWEVKDVIVHLETEQITKVLTDKYGYDYANGKNENVPLSFYFDLSGSMSSYSNMLATIAVELLKMNVKVLVGFNEKVNIQIDRIDSKFDINDLANFITSCGCYSYAESTVREKNIDYKIIKRNIDNYLIEKKAEKCVVFSDFDPICEIINLSHAVNVYWFCFESSFQRNDLSQFNGFIYKARNVNDIINGLIKINSKKFETLCYIDNPSVIKTRKRSN